MENFFYRRLNFFDKKGNPLNFEYVGPTGPSELDTRFSFISSSGSSNLGEVDVDLLDNDPAVLNFNKTDINGFNIVSWAEKVKESLLGGADVYLLGRVTGQQEFKAKISSVVFNPSNIEINFINGQVFGQRIISNGNKINFRTSYENMPGGYFKGSMHFDKVSAGLYENEQIFVVQEMYDCNGELQYGVPHSSNPGDCLNPLKYIFDKVFESPSPSPSVLSGILDVGLDGVADQFCYLSGNNPYVLSSVETFLKYEEAVDSTQNSDCCYSIAGSIETTLKAIEGLGFIGGSPVPVP